MIHKRQDSEQWERSRYSPVSGVMLGSGGGEVGEQSLLLFLVEFVAGRQGGLGVGVRRVFEGVAEAGWEVRHDCWHGLYVAVVEGCQKGRRLTRIARWAECCSGGQLSLEVPADDF